MSIDDILAINEFIKVSTNDINEGITKSTIWLKIPSSETIDILLLKRPQFRQANLYKYNGTTIERLTQGNSIPFNQRYLSHQYFTYPIKYFAGDIYLELSGYYPLSIDLAKGEERNLIEYLYQHDFIFIGYTSIMMIMMIYNLLIYLSTKDKNYLYYVLYVLFMLLAQATTMGYSFRYLWPTNINIEETAITLTSPFPSIFALLFIQNFLQLRKYSPLGYKATMVSLFLFGVGIIFALFGYYHLSFQVMQLNTLITSLFVLVVSFTLFKKIKVAKYFAFAWSFLLGGVIVFILADLHILSNTFYTQNAILIGSSIEIILLSLALANKINSYKEELFESRNEKQRLLKTQNQILDQKIKDKTKVLNKKNEDLTNTLTHLAETQSQLIQSEKMASIGQLSSGIAHEIKNAMNFILQSSRSIELNINDLNSICQVPKNQQEELNYLLHESKLACIDIKEGIKQVVKISDDLQSYARVDEADQKEIIIEDAIASIIKLLKPALKNQNISVTTQLTQNTQLYCNPREYNQLIHNVLNNCIDAIQASNSEIGQIEIKCNSNDHSKTVTIQDNGIGIQSETLPSVFDPFYTTKEIDQGKGLGLYTAKNIMNSLHGTISIESTYGLGTKVLLKWPGNGND